MRAQQLLAAPRGSLIAACPGRENRSAGLLLPRLDRMQDVQELADDPICSRDTNHQSRDDCEQEQDREKKCRHFTLMSFRVAASFQRCVFRSVESGATSRKVSHHVMLPLYCALTPADIDH